MSILAVKAGEPGFDSAFNVCAIAAILTFGLLFWLAIKSDRRREREKRGFEVKLNAGDEPAVKQKENDHG